MKKRNKKKIGKHLFYDIHKVLCVPLIWLLWRPKRIFENKNAKKRIKGGYIQIGNHNTYIDCVYLQASEPCRRLYLMAAKEVLERNKFLALFLKLFLTVPIDRDNFQLSDFKKFLSIIKEGHVLNIFPEGHINFNKGTIDDFKDGATLLSLTSSCPIKVLYVLPGKHLFSRVRIGYSEPIYLKDLGFTKKTASDASCFLRQKMFEIKELVEKDYNRRFKKHE